MRTRNPQWWRFLLFAVLSAGLVALDQWAKLYIMVRFEWGEFVAVTPFFNLCHVRNTGAAFSFLSGSGGWQLVFFSAVACLASAVILFLLWKNNHRIFFSLALSCIMAGAVGNLIDRLFWGAVIDFLDFYIGQWHWPAFNIADICICLGAAGVFIQELFFPWRSRD